MVPFRIAVGAGAAALLLLFPAAASTQAATSTTVTSLGAGESWDISSDSSGTARIDALADPVHSDGSALLAVDGSGPRAQLVHVFAPAGVLLRTVAHDALGYMVRVDSSGTSPASAPFGVNLQLELYTSAGGFLTTLSYQPQLNGTPREDTWQTYTNTPQSLWRTSRAVGGFTAGSDHTLDDYLQALGSDTLVGRTFLNIGTFADTSQTLRANVDDVTIDGTTYNFAVTGRASAEITAPSSVQAGTGGPVALSFTSPQDGIRVIHATARVTFSGISQLTPSDLTVSAGGKTYPVRRAADGTLYTELPLPGGTLNPGETATVPFRLTLAPGLPAGELHVTGRLINDGNPTTVAAATSLRVKPKQAPAPAPARRPSAHNLRPPLAGRPRRPALAATGATATIPAALGAVMLTALGGTLLAMRRRTARGGGR
ncbi:hypothetical protein [Phaeacidiphilus oryzae]|uniref:hypothetical protein n=1 Tax=Phaeacidiphilus oryzae TaxID=348818 RepID=UPI00056B4084|nr:hypothetical protein [Phaeacidiphilus oryzae]